jgi:2-polyprenyl-3-methyl-5-hydroxy-6-metoxy-1,4-benzoquinol methylase
MIVEYESNLATAKLLPARLRELWDNGPQNGLSSQQCTAKQELELSEYGAIWAGALILPGQPDLLRSTLVELARWHGIDDLGLVHRRCLNAVRSNKRDWEQRVQAVEASQVVQYYDTAHHYIDELMWWHTLSEDQSPLAYVAALEFSLLANCRAYLDFGSGVGSGALLFASYGFDVTLADISSVMLSFCEYRFGKHGRRAKLVDLKQTKLPESMFDFVTAMDVFEHLVDPVATVEALDYCLKPGGYIYLRLAAETDQERPQHIALDFRPVCDRFAQLGFKEVYRDDWLWGHQVFRKHA